ncbi:uncharacterized protein KY384_008675 [Bacidia gigantensis]|uniref:uncharacterized protein n=1 Tax=Bacidia gigantensis TaxID=2732470 RepID=UPI001D050FA8|nr:uncharacterized protein KY384_008675 [Bacidia gigantensis]KAG8526475.1 hypothetical protein KY384_008675 [Bacidia gigantensis]
MEDAALFTDANARKSGHVSAEQKKAVKILVACNEPPDIDALVTYATTRYGLVDDEMSGPILLRGAPASSNKDGARRSWKDLPPHRDEEQVRLDVDRSFVYYPKCDNEQQLVEWKDQLSWVILKVLRENQCLCYFQGYHDIVQVLLLVLGASKAPASVTCLSFLRIRDFMLPSLAPSLDQLMLLPSIVSTIDPGLSLHLSSTRPFFALSATLTMYAHEIEGYGQIVRLFDFLIAHPSVVSLYFFAVIILSRREELLEIPTSEPEMLHSVLSKLPKPLDIEALIGKTVILFTEHPPETLPDWTWQQISSHSVLKTTRWLKYDTVDNGKRIFERQAKHVRRVEMKNMIMIEIWKRRRPAAQVGIAIGIGLFSFWIGKDGYGGQTGLAKLAMHRVWDIVQQLDFNENTHSRSKILPDSSAPYSSQPPGQAPSKRFLWTLSFYAQFFDVDTTEVLRRCTSSLYPRTPFLDILDGNPDLYGPFWIATTVVFILFLTGTISQYLSDHHHIHFEYNFKLLSGAAGLIYGYTGFVPVGLWACLKWFGAESATLIECWALYGYGNCIWIPVALISWSPITLLNYIFVGLGFLWSVVFLVRNLWPVVNATDAKISKILVIVVVALHAGLAIAIKILFFA